MNSGPARAFLCAHARARCIEMGVDRAEVVETMLHPQATYPSADAYGPNRRVAVGGRLAVVYTEDDYTVITVLWTGRTSRDEGALWVA